MRIVIVDDDSFVTTSLSTILSAEPDVEVVGVGHSGQEALALYAQSEPDILLIDIRMPEMSGLEAAAALIASSPDARIIFLSTFADDEYIIRALQMGARGYLIKQEVASIAPALRSVMAGQNVLGSEVLDRMGSLMGHLGHPPTSEDSALAQLSQRESEIVELIAQGLDNREIAARLFISEGTTRNHISTILTKLGLKNRTQLAVLYYQS